MTFMYWVPFLSFLGSGVIAAYAERAYFNGLIASGSPLRTDENLADLIRGDPRGLFRIVRTETIARLRLLAARQHSPRLERQRRVALLSIFVALTCFVWSAWLH